MSAAVLVLLAVIGLGEAVDVWAGISWKNFAGWSDGKEVLTGSASVLLAYSLDASKTYPFQDARDILDITNFYGSSSNRIKQGSQETAAELNGKNVTLYAQALVFVGDYSQKVAPKCIPFDEQLPEFTLLFPAPMRLLDLHLMCMAGTNGQRCQEFDRDGNLLARVSGHPATRNRSRNVYKTVDHFWTDHEAHGMYWSALTCELRTPDGVERSIRCFMKANRNVMRELLRDMLPGFVMTLIGFGSFLVPIKYAMPRIATSMIALLTFTGQSTAVMMKLPSKESSFLQDYYITGLCFQLCNVLGHILCLKFSELHLLLDHFSAYVMFFTFGLIISLDLYIKDCPQVYHSLTVVTVLVSAVGVVVAFVFVLRESRKQIRKKLKYLSDVYHGKHPKAEGEEEHTTSDAAGGCEDESSPPSSDPQAEISQSHARAKPIIPSEDDFVI